MTCPRRKALSSLAETCDHSPKVVSLADRFRVFSIASDWNFSCFSSFPKRLTLWHRPLEQPLDRRTSRNSEVIPASRRAERIEAVAGEIRRGRANLGYHDRVTFT
jgi:hypothetical protein